MVLYCLLKCSLIIIKKTGFKSVFCAYLFVFFHLVCVSAKGLLCSFSPAFVDTLILFLNNLVQWFRSSAAGQYTTLNIVVIIILLV